MPNVLVIGAQGYIGSHLCQQLIRDGNHQVFGLSRSEKEGFRLALQEIIPLRGNLATSKNCLESINSSNIDVIVDTTSFNDDVTKLKLLEIIQEAAEKRSSAIPKGQAFKGPKLGFVTVSEIWSHGSTEDPSGKFEPATLETLGTTPPAGLPSIKALYEKKVLEATSVLDVAILQPSFVFAKGGASWTRILKGIVDAAQNGSTDTVRIAVDPKKKRLFIHKH